MDVQENSVVAKPKKKLVKRWWFWVIIAVAVIAVYSISSGAGSEDSPKASSEENSQPEEQEKPSTGESDVIIKDCEYGKDYQDKPTIIANFEWTNTTDDATSLITNYSIKAFQNGVELDESYFSDDWEDGMDASWVDSTKEVKPGATIKTSIVYLVADKTAPVEIEVTDFWGNDVLTKKTFDPK
jgi:hypothetical protein